MRDQQDAAVFGSGVTVHALADDSQRVNVQSGVGFVEDRDLGLEQFQLQDLVALLFAAGEPLVDVALREGRVDLECGHRGLELFHPEPQLGRLAADGRRRRAQEVRHRDAGHLDRILHGQKHAGPGAFVDAHRQHVRAIQRDRSDVTRYLG